MSESKQIILGVSGGIAAYKACEIVRLLKKQGHNVQVVMTRDAIEFVSAQTFWALSQQEVCVDDFSNYSHSNAMEHIALARKADAILIAPATANTLAKIANGIADNLLTTMVLARGDCPLIVSPAMNTQMWNNLATQRNIKQLIADGVKIINPNSGELACGEVGIGKMASYDEIVDLLSDVWCDKCLSGRNVLITLGATMEMIDPVRGITNISTGRMGVALSRACRRAGANVHIVHGSVAIPLPYGMSSVENVVSAKDMYDAVMKKVADCDVFISVAAVADYKVLNKSDEKIKKNNCLPVIELTENPDILASVAKLDNPPFCVGFAAESNRVIEYAREKRIRKNIPMLVANQVDLAMGKTTNSVTIIDGQQEITLPQMDKDKVAMAIVKRLSELL
ncbi:MAG: bifunctional phosphopantothenoylcysteine decarboxylase/phosphopantothenate--cysteine ligase CoaBC [Neisseriaceae bacterium]|nr:bifunctional phosphopantothenoylcysteine decarboxylase/phosphopantothenate--cysteine ligase CoaBC [Neisseriaceae bacterium]